MNDPEFLGVDAFIIVNPFLDESSRLKLRNGVEIHLAGSKTKFLNIPFSNLQETKTYLENTSEDKLLSTQKPALNALIEVIEKQSHNIMPIYGYSIRSSESTGNYKKKYFPNNIIQILMGARLAQLSGSENMKKPLIIPVFYDYENESEQLHLLLHSDNWGKYEVPGVNIARKQIKALGLAEALNFASASDLHSIEMINNLQPGQILLLSMGSLPKVVFDGIYNHVDQNIWPQIREGANTFHTLIQTGKPHFRCTDYFIKDKNWEIGFDWVDDSVLKTQLQEFYNQFCLGDDSMWQDNQTYYQLAQFIQDAQDPGSSLSKYFITLSKVALDPVNDKIRFDLEKIIENLGQ